jgi:hypothetical protein
MLVIFRDFAEPVFLNVYGAPESIQGMNSASLFSLAGRYDNPLPPRFLAPIASLKIPARFSVGNLPEFLGWEERSGRCLHLLTEYLIDTGLSALFTFFTGAFFPVLRIFSIPDPGSASKNLSL